MPDQPRGLRSVLSDRPVLRLVALGAGSLVLLLVVSNLIAEVLVGGGPSANTEAAIAQLDRVEPGSVILDPNASPKKLDDPRGMGSQHAGLALVARSEVEKVSTDSGPRRAPEGSTLVAFRLADWDCEEPPCASWETLTPQVVLDGRVEDLPEGGDTFVVVVPPGTEDVELAIDADGFSQSLSLRDDTTAGASNIALLAVPDRETRTVINQTFRVVEHTSTPLQSPDGQVADVFNRDVVVDYAQRRFFFKGATPGNPRRAFLIVNIYYTYAGQTTRYVPLDEVTFVDPRGHRYAGRDVDPNTAVALLGFDIPANVTKGTLVVGGTHTRTSTTGATYTSTLDEKTLPINLR